MNNVYSLGRSPSKVSHLSVVSHSDIPTGEIPKGRYGSVTRNGSLTHETINTNLRIFTPKIPNNDYPFFIDWISISQSHDFELPVISSGVIQAFTSEGEKEWQTVKYLQHEGSFSSRVNVRCDGSTVYFSGNPSRFNRPDNLFGYDLDTCIEICNSILDFFGLPPFTKGKLFFLQGSKNSDAVGYTGACIQRLDLTANYSTGSQSDAGKYIRWLLTQKDNRANTKPYGMEETAVFGEGSKRLMHKVYNKFIQLDKDKSKTISTRVLDFVKTHGIVRHEITLKSRYLRDGGLRYLGIVNMEHLHEIYKQKSEILRRAERATDGFDSLPAPLRLTARDWKAGQPFEGSRAKQYRHRKELLKYGIDILKPCSNPDILQVIEVVTLSPVTAPSWYWQVAA